MFAKLVKHSLRALNRQRGYVFINIVGLSFGIACSLVIALFILHEFSYDRFNEKHERLYQLVLDGKIGGQEMQVSNTCSPVGPTIRKEIPEVEDITRVNTWGETIIKYQDQSFTETEFVEADSTFFNLFSIPLLVGDKRTVLNAPHKLVLSETTAKKIFGNDDPIGKMLKVGTDSTLYAVTGIMADFPELSHFEANILASFVTNRRANDNQWTSNSFETYVLLKPNSNPREVDSKLNEILRKNVGVELEKYIGITLDEFFAKGNRYRMYLQLVTDIHLNPGVSQSAKPTSNPKYLLIFGSIAILIIVIAAINFMNLSTAQSSKRAKEVGIKKVSGSTRTQLVWQFVAESMVLTFVSLVLAILIIQSALPYFNNLLQIKLELNLMGSWYSIPFLLALAVLVGIIAGSYPAFYLSSFSPYRVLKGKLRDSMKTGVLRSMLVVLQFTISIVLIIGTLIMFRQINFMLKKDLGFDRDRLLVISRAEAIGGKIKAFKESVKSIPGVVRVAASTAVPSHNNNNNGYMVEGQSDETFLFQTCWADYDFFETYGIKLSNGRLFDESHSTDNQVCIINESSVQKYGFTDPLSVTILRPSDDPQQSNKFPVIGVVKDFHFESLQNEISPYLFMLKPDQWSWGYVSIKLAETANEGTIKEIEKVWREFTANDPMQYFFMDQNFNRLYREDQRSASLSIIFTFLAILIAALGLYGLTSFTVEQRTKEMGVRKALGATVTSLFVLISKEILILIAISTAIAWPLVYFVAQNWLQNYYYRISLTVFDFIAGFLIAASIAIATISYRALKTARVNPAESLRYE
jgi:putative ABC transport system permease protein